MTEIVTEYLICIDNKIPLFVNEQSIKDFLGLNERDKFTVEVDHIRFEGIVVDYSIVLNQSDKERIFNLKFVYKQEDIDNHFVSCLNLREKIRESIEYLPKLKICTIWDDLSFKQSKEAYPYIYEVENLMRKLITKFMVINVGTQWAIDAVPEKMRTRKRGTTTIGDDPDVLYKLDFRELTDILLARNTLKISEAEVTKIYLNIFKAKTSTELNINELKNVVSLSIWQKHFADLIHYDSKKLKTDWEKLYNLRCKIAHNNFLDKNDYQSITDLTKELKIKLQSAIEKLEQIKLTEEEKENISENSRDLISRDFTTRRIVNDELRRTLIDSGILTEGGMQNIFSDLNETLRRTAKYSSILTGGGMQDIFSNLNETLRRTAKDSGLISNIEATRRRTNIDKILSESPIESGDNLIEETENIEDKSFDEESKQ